MNSLIIIPVLNESGTLKNVISRIRTSCDHDILVVDDGSSDGSGTIALENGAGLITLPINLGAWGAIQTGMKYALSKGYQAVVTMDGDNQHAPGYINTLLQELDQSNDVVIGSCLERGSAAKHFIWYILKNLSGLDIADITSGFRAYNTKAMQLLLTRESQILDYQDIGVLMICRNNGLQIKEITVEMQDRTHGKSKIYKNSAMILRYLLSTLFLIGTKRW
ncbi:MAG: glycosyltransferase family 2 protein [Thermodesulfobacteriota bacterium]|nr:glycosyltransferase family 2 protein [Thermodesulfobacteriota bacterium]